MRDGVADDVGQRLLDERRVGAHQRQVGRQVDGEPLGGAAPAQPRSTTRSTTSRRSTQSLRSSSAPASMRVIASRLRTMPSRASASSLIWPSRSFCAVRAELVAVVEQAGRRAQDRRQRRAEIVRDRRQQRVAHALGLGGGAGGDDLARERRALQRRRGLLGQRVEQRARLGIGRPRAPPPGRRPPRRPGCAACAAAGNTRAPSAEWPCRRRPARRA